MQQKSAVLHGTDLLLIVAGAGTGKTTTLAHRVAWQVISGISPDRILLLTFSRRASSEMLRRVDSILSNVDLTRKGSSNVSGRAARRIRRGTFHSVAANLLRRHGPLIGLCPGFTILDRADSEDLMNLVRSRLDLPAAPKRSKKRDRFPKGTCIEIYSLCVNTQQQLDKVIRSSFTWCLPYEQKLLELFTEYSTSRSSSGFWVLTTFYCSGTRCWKTNAEAKQSGNSSTAYWLTNIRTQMFFRPRS